MGRVVQLLALGMEHDEAADLRPERRGVSGDILERLGNSATEQPIQGAGVLQRQGTQGVRQGKDHMGVGRLEDLLLPGSQPRGLRGAMAFGAAAVPAGIIRLDFVATVVALRNMPPEGGGPAHGDGPQGPMLRAREGGPIALEKGVAMLA